MAKMTKSQMLADLAEKTGLSKKDVANLLDTLTEMAYKEVKNAGEFALPGIGKLVKVDRKARIGRNPATGEDLMLEAHKIVTFKCSGSLRDQINKGKR